MIHAHIPCVHTATLLESQISPTNNKHHQNKFHIENYEIKWINLKWIIILKCKTKFEVNL